MHDIRGLAAQQLQGGTAEKAKPLGIIRIIAARRAVKKVAIEVGIGTDQVNRHVIADRGLEYRCFLPAVGNRNGEFVGHLAQNEIALKGRTIGRRDDADFVTEPRQCDRKRAEHVGQAAGLGEGRDFGGNHRDLHLGSLKLFNAVAWRGLAGLFFVGQKQYR